MHRGKREADAVDPEMNVAAAIADEIVGKVIIVAVIDETMSVDTVRQKIVTNVAVVPKIDETDRPKDNRIEMIKILHPLLRQ